MLISFGGTRTVMNEMRMKTELYPWQEKAVDKLIGIRVGALY